MKKTFFQVSIILYMALCLLLLIIAAAFYVLVDFLLNIETAELFDWLCAIAAIGMAIFLSYVFIQIARNRIVVNEKDIYVPAYWGKTHHVAQLSVRIRFDEIKAISIKSSTKNSNNEVPVHFVPMPYIVFECQSGEKKAINVLYYSKKQVVQIIDLAIERAKLLGNDLQNQSGKELLTEFLKHEKTVKNRK